ncbi:MAG: nitrite transporter NirC [Alphaproteobacteria bacterium HGW-Alphaproteobacteria-1]|jgi:nitrite transporter NirC|nr:MAG: nitrite transporter NirC [Alphaproteobacteria bacterium HGW-Alphaproteobacteria-1]
MTIAETVAHFARYAADKDRALGADPLAFALSAMKAGAYVGIGIILIFTLGQSADPSWRNLVMGASFGIALTLVVFAGSDLFTGHAMYGAHARLSGSLGTGAVLRLWAASWSGNLAGAFALSVLFVLGGGGAVLEAGGEALIQTVAAKKMAGGAAELVARGMLCNWLVCLAIWTSARSRSDTAKCILIFWCLLAFIASGFEHSVANMTVFSLALMAEHPDKVGLSGAIWNLGWVTLGNVLSGAGVMGWGYWRIGNSGVDSVAPRQAD